jgi:Effector Associated Constant Component 1
MTNGRIEARIAPESSLFTTGSEGWLEEQEALRADLERALGPGVVKRGEPEPNAKGVPLIPIVVALGGAHFFQSLARAFEAWIRYRPGERSLTMTADIDGKKITVQINARNAPLDALQPVMQALGEALK